MAKPKEQQIQIRDMTQGSPLRHILFFALPLILGSTCQQIYTLTDTAVVGRVLGVRALAALGACDLLVWMVSNALQCFMGGFSIRLAHAFGARNQDLLQRTAATSAVLGAATGLLAFLLMEAASPQILTWMQVQPEVRPLALLYLRIIFAGIPFLTASSYSFALLRAFGNSRVPFLTMLLSAGVNIVLDLLFVAGLHLGIGGAAFATWIAQGITAVCSLTAARRLLPGGRSGLRFDACLIPSLLQLAVPMSVQLLISAIGGLVIQTVVNQYEITFIAGFTAAYKLFGILEMAAIAYGQAIATYTGQNLGAGAEKRVQNGILQAWGAALATSAVLTVLIFLFGEQIVRIFISGTPGEVRAAVPVGLRFLRMMGVSLSMLYTTHLFGSFLQGLGHAGITAANGILELCCRVLTVTALAGWLGSDCVFYAELSAWFAGSLWQVLAAVYLLLSGRRKAVEDHEAL